MGNSVIDPCFINEYLYLQMLDEDILAAIQGAIAISVLSLGRMVYTYLLGNV